ncbi:MAG: thioredoxin family protein [Bacteroidota bacterium]
MKKGIILAVTLLLGAGVWMAASFTTTEAPPLKVGDVAPAFTLKNVDGKMYPLREIKDANGNTPKGYVVTFTCNTCPYAVMYEDRIQEMHEKLSPMGFPVVAVMPNDIDVKPGDSLDKMKERADDKGFTFKYLIDEKQDVYPMYGASRTPEVFLLTPNDKGQLILRYTGAIDDNAQNADAVTVNYVEKAVKAVMSNQEPSPSKVKAIGCSIKVKK